MIIQEEKKRFLRAIILSLILGVILFLCWWYVFQLLANQLNLPKDFFFSPLIGAIIFYYLIISIGFVKRYRLLKHDETYLVTMGSIFEESLRYKSALTRGAKTYRESIIFLLIMEIILIPFQLYLIYTKKWWYFILCGILQGVLAIIFLGRYYNKIFKK